MTVLLALLSLPAEAGWRDDVAAAVAACAQDPAPCAVANGVLLRETRAGHLMTHDPRIQDPAVLGPLLDRLLRETDPAIRAGLADGVARALLARTDTTWHAAWAELAATHDDPQVRTILIGSLRRAPLAVAGPGLRQAILHPDAVTRLDAAAIMGGHPEARTFVPELVKAAADPDAGVRAAAVKALGWAGDPSAREAVQRALADEDPKVRHEAERALERLAG